MTETATIVNALAAAGYRRACCGWSLNGEPVDEAALQVAVVKTFQAHSIRPTGTRVRGAIDASRALPLDAAETERQAAASLPVPTTEELADEAAWWVDTFFMYSLTFTIPALWDFDNDSVLCDVVPSKVRKTAFRAGMTVAAAHGVPDQAPTMRQVVNALIRRLSRDGRLRT